MAKRKGEKIGWTAGWLGAFIWVAGLAIFFLFQRKWLQGFLGLILIIGAVFSIIFLSPWRHPKTHYWKLMIGPYGFFLASVVWLVWAYGGVKAAGFDWWTLSWLLPLLIPFGILSQRRWIDFEAQLLASREKGKQQR